MRPAYRITVDGKETTFTDRLISLTLRDVRGFEADTLQLSIDDHDGLVALPRKGAVLGVHIGWEGDALIDKGTFVVDEVGHSGPPDVVTIGAKSADFLDALKEQRTQLWKMKTIEQIVKTIAARYKLTSAVSASLSARVTTQNQTGESDAHFLTRLAVIHDAVATIKGGTLLFLRAAEATSASGKALEPITIERSDGDTHTFNEPDRVTKFTGVKATARDADHRITDVLIGAEGKTRALKQTYPTEAEARAAAEAEWRRISRAAATMSVTLAKGKPEIITETPVTLTGWKKEICELPWIVAEVTHELNDRGLTNGLKLEPPSSEIPESSASDNAAQ